MILIDEPLKPCPFCGEPATFYESGIHQDHQASAVTCTKCPAMLGTNDLTAKDCWNRRVESKTTEELVAELYGEDNKQGYLAIDEVD